MYIFICLHNVIDIKSEQGNIKFSINTGVITTSLRNNRYVHNESRTYSTGNC